MARLILWLLALLLATPAAAQPWPTTEGNFVVENFRFQSGETLPKLRIHYTTLGTPRRGADGKIDNAVMVLHGTGGSGMQFLQPQFAGELYGPGAPFDLATTYVILPDNIGHGGSSRPSDGLRMAFPRYDYADMVELQRRMLVDALGVTKLRLILGTSMGCMHAFVWGTTHPGFAERLAPFACNPVEIAGRNRLWRKLSIDAIRADPAWNGGNYASPPLAGMRTATSLSIVAGANPLAMQVNFPTRAAIEAEVGDNIARRFAGAADANDTLYWLDASRNYDPSPLLERIAVPVLWINSADDFINPPELGIAEREAKRMPRAKFILIPGSPETRGHGTHTWARFWKNDLAQLLATP
jgi:homoserine O-acetyltransferase/O-succinyltransferase